MGMQTRFSIAIALTLPALLWAGSAGAEERTTSLYERLGGAYAIATVVDAFIERLLVNEMLNANPAIAAARKRVPKAGLKYHVTSFMIQATGGPKVYVGRSMEAAHDHLNITEGEWTAMTKDFRTILNRFKVPEAEQEELFALVGSVKPDIVMDQSTTSLDGKVYVGYLSEGTKPDRGDTYADTFTFKDGKFHSAACDPWHCGAGQYTTSIENGVTHFHAETTSPTDGRMVWEGVARSDKLEGTMRWYPQPSDAPIEYWFNGTAS
jgi:hemoglobin